MNNTFLVGIFFDALVSATVALAAVLFVLFLFRRWESLDNIRRAYAWFWFFTMLTWVTISLRYFAISFGYTGIGVYLGDIIVEGTIFFTGPPLFYYLSLRLFQKKWITNFLTICSAALAFVGLFFLLSPGGISAVHMTDFSADVSINGPTFAIFAGQIFMIIGLVVYDIVSYFLERRKNKKEGTVYELLYSLPLLTYLVLGAIDQSKIILDWPLVVFRILYASAFLFAYLVISQDESRHEEYFLKNLPPSLN